MLDRYLVVNCYPICIIIAHIFECLTACDKNITTNSVGQEHNHKLTSCYYPIHMLLITSSLYHWPLNNSWLTLSNGVILLSWWSLISTRGAVSSLLSP